MIELKSSLIVGLLLFAVAVRGDEIWTAKNCWDNRSDAPPTKLSDLGVDGFLRNARVASLDAKWEARLAKVKPKMTFLRLPKKVALHDDSIPVTLVEAAGYLTRYICMAYPPILCIETDDAFYFSGGRATMPVYDFSSGMAIMKADGSIWGWDQVEEDAETPAAE